MKGTLLHISLLIFFLSSCDKNFTEHTVIDTFPITGNIEKLYNDLKNTPQGHSIDCSKPAIIDLADGSQIEIKAFSFLDEQGNIYYGNAQILALVAKDPGDFIIQKMTSRTNNGIISTYKSLYFSARSEEGDLHIRAQNLVTLRLAQTKSRTDQALYYFDFLENDKEWQLVSDTDIKEVSWKSGDQKHNGLSFSIDQFAWFGVHSLRVFQENAQFVCFEVPPVFVSQNTGAFAIGDRQTIIPLSWDSGQSFFCLDQTIDKHEMKFFLLSAQGSGNYYYSILGFSSDTSNYFMIEPELSDQQTIKNILETL